MAPIAYKLGALASAVAVASGGVWIATDGSARSASASRPAVTVSISAVWVTRRRASETIPPGAHLLRVSVRSQIKGNQPRQRPFSVTSAKEIDGIVALLNALPAAQPGVRSCPVDFGIRVRLVFYARRSSVPSAVAEIDPWGCGGVQMAIGGKPQPPLASGPLPGSGGRPSRSSLMQQLDHLLGVKLNTSPPAATR